MLLANDNDNLFEIERITSGLISQPNIESKEHNLGAAPTTVVKEHETHVEEHKEVPKTEEHNHSHQKEAEEISKAENSHKKESEGHDKKDTIAENQHGKILIL